MDKRIVSLVNDATIGLQGDPELRLDVQSELSSHLESAVQKGCAEGKGVEESVEEALQTFGSPLELAGEILDANLRRLRLRALARLAVQVLLLPLALILSVFQGVKVYHDFHEYGLYTSQITWKEYPDIDTDIIEGQEIQKESISVVIFRKALEHFKLPYGDYKFVINETNEMPLQRPSQEMPAIATDHPDNKIFWGYYATQYIHGDRPEIVDIAEHGKLIDPENALYNYMLAYHYLRLAYRFDLPDGTRPILKDKRLFLLGVEELKQAEDKKGIYVYRAAMMEKRFQLMGKAENYADHLRYLAFYEQEFYGDLTIYVALARQYETILYYVTEMGRNDLVEVPLLLPVHLSRQLASSADFPLQILSARAIANKGGSEVADLAERTGHKEIAEKLRENEELFKLSIPHEERSSLPVWEQSLRSGGIIVKSWASYYPWYPYIQYQAKIFTKEKLAPSRNLDYLLFDRIMFSVMQVILLALLVWSSICWGIWALTQRKRRGAGLLLLPPALVAARIAILGILLPLALYLLYTLLPAINGRNVNIYFVGNRMLVEFSLISLVILAAPVIIATHYLHSRFSILQLPIPPMAFRWKVYLTSLLFLLLPLPIYYGLQWIKTFAGENEYYIFAGIVILLFIVALLFLYIKLRPHAQYFGILYRSLLPVYALALLLIAAVTQPYISYREAQLVAAEHLVLPKTADMQPPIERMILEQIKSNFIAAEKKETDD